MPHEILEAPDLADDLANRLRLLEIRVVHVFGQALPSAAKAAAIAHVYRDHLAGQFGAHVAVETSHGLLQHLIDPADARTPAFWSSPTGRAIGYWIGGQELELNGESIGIPQAQVAALLGMSRQGVNDAIKRGRLASVAPGLGVSALSVVNFMHTRYPVQVAA